MADKQLVTVQEIADVMGVGASVAAVEEGLRAERITVVEDWAGRPSVAFVDAKATIARHRKQQAEWEERSRRELAEQHEGHLAQLEFDDVCGRTLPLLRKADPFNVDPQADGLRMARARTVAWEQISSKYSPAALAMVMMKPHITTIEPTGVQAFRPIPILAPMSDTLFKKEG